MGLGWGRQWVLQGCHAAPWLLDTISGKAAQKAKTISDVLCVSRLLTCPKAGLAQLKGSMACEGENLDAKPGECG